MCESPLICIRSRSQTACSTILDIVDNIFDNDLGQFGHKLAKLGIFFFQRLNVRFLNVLSEWRRLDLSGANSAFRESFSHRTEPLYCYWRQRLSLRQIRKSP